MSAERSEEARCGLARVYRQGSKPCGASALCRSAQCCAHRMRCSHVCLIAALSSQRASSLLEWRASQGLELACPMSLNLTMQSKVTREAWDDCKGDLA